MSAARFWGSAVGVAAAFALLALLLLPYEALQLRTEAARWRAWLLTLWTSGVMAVLFGLTGLIAHRAPVGVRDVAEAGSVAEALRRQADAVRARGTGALRANFAWWLVVVGGLLIGLYFAGWLVVRS